MEILGWGLLGLSLIYVAAWRKGWLGWVAALLMAGIALMGGVFVFAMAGLAGIAIPVALALGEDIRDLTRQQEVLMIGSVIGAIIGILPLAWKLWHAIARSYSAGLEAGYEQELSVTDKP